MRAFFSAFAALALFTTATQAGKRGLAWTWWNSPLDASVFDSSDGQVVAIHDYETYLPPSTNGSGSLTFIGTQRCLDCDSSPVGQLATRQKEQGWTIVFSLDEPDTFGISPGDAAPWYKQYINPLPVKKALPGISSSTGSGEGLDWLQQMLDACDYGCYFDYINLHWYGPDFPTFQSYVELAHARFPTHKIIISAFTLRNPAGGEVAQVEFFSQAFAYLDEQDFIELYFPYVATTPSLLQQYSPGAVASVGTSSCLYTDDGKLSAVGDLMF